MPIDASIYDRLIQPVKQPDSFADIVTASANMKNAQALAEDRRMLVQDKIRQAQEDGQVRQVMSDPNTDMPTKIQHLYTINPKVAGDVEKTYIANQKTQVDLTDLINNHAASNLALYDPKDPSSWGHVQAAQTALYKLVNLPVPAQYQGPPPTPEEVDKWRQTSLTVQQQNEAAKKHLEKDTFGMPGPNGQTSTVLGAFDPSTGQRFVAGPDGQLTPAIGATAKEADDKVQSAEIEAIKAFTAANGRKPTEAELDGIHKRFKEAGTVVRVSTGAGGASGLSTGEGGGLELAGTMTRLLGRIPVGMARGGNTAAIMNEAAKQNKLIGQTPVAMMQKAAVYASDKKALDNLTKQSSAAEAYENKAQAQLDIVDGLSDKVKRTSIPLLNRAILAGETSIMGDPDATLLLNSIQTASAEYAKIMMGGTASAAALTDSAQKEAQKLLSASMNPTTLRKATQLMRTEMGLTMQGYDAAKQHIATSLGGGAPAAVPEQTGAAPPGVVSALQSKPPNSPGKAYTLSDGSRWVKAADGSISKAP